MCSSNLLHSVHPPFVYWLLIIPYFISSWNPYITLFLLSPLLRNSHPVGTCNTLPRLVAQLNTPDRDRAQPTVPPTNEKEKRGEGETVEKAKKHSGRRRNTSDATKQGRARHPHRRTRRRQGNPLGAPPPPIPPAPVHQHGRPATEQRQEADAAGHTGGECDEERRAGGGRLDAAAHLLRARDEGVAGRAEAVYGELPGGGRLRVGVAVDGRVASYG